MTEGPDAETVESPPQLRRSRQSSRAELRFANRALEVPSSPLGDHGTHAGREYEGASAVPEPLNERFAPRDESPGRAERLPQGAQQHVGDDPLLGTQAPSVGPKDPQGMGLIDDECGARLVAELPKGREVR